MSSDPLADYKYLYQKFTERLTFVAQVLSPIILFTENERLLWEKFHEGAVDFYSSKE